MNSLVLDGGSAITITDGELDAFYNVQITDSSSLSLINGTFIHTGNGTFTLDATSSVNATALSTLILYPNGFTLMAFIDLQRSAKSLIYSELQLTSDTIFNANQIHFFAPQVFTTSNLVFNLSFFSARIPFISVAVIITDKQ